MPVTLQQLTGSSFFLSGATNKSFNLEFVELSHSYPAFSDSYSIHKYLPGVSQGNTESFLREIWMPTVNFFPHFITNSNCINIEPTKKNVQLEAGTKSLNFRKDQF